jgi:penicillin-binding protein 1A
MVNNHDNDQSPDDMDRYFNDPEYRRKKVGRARWRPSVKFVSASILVLILLIGIGVYTAYLLSGLPSLERIENPKPELATRVFSADGEILDQFFIKNRSHVGLQDIPSTVVNALIATEDKDFHSHWGVDAIRFIKAQIKNLIALRFTRGEGASTITMQLSRNLYLGHEDSNVFDTVTRKIREFITAVQLERNFTKEEILEFYLNVVYFGRGAYGIGSASQVYFGKSPAELSLGEAATLIALLKGPSLFDPKGKHPDLAQQRRSIVLGQMVKYGYISAAQADEAKEEREQALSMLEASTTGIATNFVEYVRQQMLQKAEKYGFDIYRDGITVYTTLDGRMQRYANQAVEEHLRGYQRTFDSLWNWGKEREALTRVIDQSIRTSAEYRKAGSSAQRDSVYTALKNRQAWVDSMKKVAQTIEVGFVVLDPHAGAIRAMVGGANFRSFKYGLNHVTQIRRQAGSAFKPFVYTVAIDNGYPPTYEILNQPVIIMMPDGSRWAPSNADGDLGGKVTIRDAIKRSINLVAVRTVVEEFAPVNLVIDYAKRMGISSPLPPYASLALGAGEVEPLEMAAAFGVYANHGVYVEPISIIRIEDKDGTVIEENLPLQREVLSEETSFIMTSMMQSVVDDPQGTGARVRSFFHYPAAGKTGTTTDFADAWFVGFTPQLSAAVWVGFDNRSVHFTNWDGQGGRAAAPIWGRFMKNVYDDPSIAMPVEYFQRPAGVYADTICVETKLRATQYCPTTMVEYFTEKMRPGTCQKHATSKWREGEEGLGKVSF